MDDKPKKLRAHVRIEGRVQGVFFRASTRDKARRAGVRGWVRNCRDGSVEAVFEGPRKAVVEVLAWCYRGSDAAMVENVDVDYEEPTGEFDSFRVRH
jgi:acylphosphatase